MCSKKISINDVLSNFEEYSTTKGFNYDDTMYEKVSKYMIWLSSKLDKTSFIEIFLLHITSDICNFLSVLLSSVFLLSLFILFKFCVSNLRKNYIYL